MCSFRLNTPSIGFSEMRFVISRPVPTVGSAPHGSWYTIYVSTGFARCHRKLPHPSRGGDAMLPQGAVAAGAASMTEAAGERGAAGATPMMAQYLEIKAAHPDAL